MYVHKPLPDQTRALFSCGFPWRRMSVVGSPSLRAEMLPKETSWDWAASPLAPHLWKNDCFDLEWSLDPCGWSELNFWEPFNERPLGLWAIVLVHGITTSLTGNTKPITCQMSLGVNCSLSEGVTCVKLFSCALMAQSVMGVMCCEEQETRMPVSVDGFQCWV